VAGRELPWEEAMARFTDRTGRPGPATWEAGDYPEGQAEHPVSGVSWYEAAAYAESAGKSLPTIYHWYTAAGMGASTYIAPLGNLSGPGPARVGSHQGLGPFGTYDMAGNVREWCWNDSNRGGQRFILGGSWIDPAYAFGSDAVTQPPFDRSPGNGFRCVKYLGEAQDEPKSARTIDLSFRDFLKETPSSQKEVGTYLRQYAYDRTPLNGETVSTNASAEEWTKEKVTFDAASGGERVTAYLFLPKRVAPPYQVVFVWPGDMGLQLPSADTPRTTRLFDFVVKSGRAVLFPVFKGMYERHDGLESTLPNETAAYRDRVVLWVKEARRSVDYLEARSDIDVGKLAYFGHSWGGRLSGIALAVDTRFKTAVLYVAGFRFPRSMPEVDPFNFVSRVRIPVLMLNGRYDHYFPVETAQKPMFALLGTPARNKKWIVYDGGHFVPRDQLVKETLAWLDRYLGPAK
jgi:dienelactone hydrolase